MGGVVLSAVLVLLYSVLLWFGDKAKMIDEQTRTTSITYPYLQEYPKKVKAVAMHFQPVVQDLHEYTVH